MRKAIVLGVGVAMMVAGCSGKGTGAAAPAPDAGPGEYLVQVKGSPVSGSVDVTASCNAGDEVLSGGCRVTVVADTFRLISDVPDGDPIVTGWRCVGATSATDDMTRVIAEAVCASR